MDRILIGQVSFRRVPESRAHRKHVERRIADWLDRRYPRGAPRQSEYRVVFERLGVGHDIGCETELTIGMSIWRGSDIGPTPEEALARAMFRLRCVGGGSPRETSFEGGLQPALAV
jgi:hypothetical protein